MCRYLCLQGEGWGGDGVEMKTQTNSTIIDRPLQRTLRNQMTNAEIRLWQRLLRRQLAGGKFRRQHP
jgi:very-short-patch-repair endonuclease